MSAGGGRLKTMSEQSSAQPRRTASETLTTARAFLDREGRLVERRLAATLFDGADPTGAVAAIAAYRNDDGGFGHGLEPDKRCPDSLPIDVETALEHLWTSGAAADPAVVQITSAACDWLASVAHTAGAGGAVPLSLPVMERYPRAEHWTDWTYTPGLNPTAGLAGRLYRAGAGADHPWLAQATDWCWARLESGFSEDAHALGEALLFLQHVPDRERAEAVARQVPEWLAGVAWFRSDPDDPGYGVTPLHFAPVPDSRWRPLFADDVVDAHLDRMVRDQQADGGWAISWEPPGQASTLEWRGIETLRSLRTLRAYGRL
jgi:hypothetical protein